VSDDRTSVAQLLLELQARMAESHARLAALLAKLRRRGDPPPRDEPSEPPPFRPAAGARPPPLPAEPLDARSKAAA
jgi:hypothetical protein